MTSQTYAYFSKAYILVFAAMLGFCIFFRHGVEHSRYVLMGMTFIFFITHKKHFKELCTSDSFRALLSFFVVALASLMLNSVSLSRIDEVVNWIVIFIAGYVASIITQDKNIRFVPVVPVALLGAIVIFPVVTGAGWNHLDIFSEERLEFLFREKANHLGLICGMFAFATSYLGMRCNGWMKICSFLLAGTCAFLLFRTAARASFLGTVIVFSGWMIFLAQKMHKHIIIAVLLAGVFAIVVLFYSPLNNNRIVSSVANGLEDDLSYLQRFFTWNVAYMNFEQKPLIGKGFDSFSDLYKMEINKYNADSTYKAKYPHTIPSTNNAHNFFLHFLAETGVLGLTAILLFWTSIVRNGLGKHDIISPIVAGMFLISLIAFQMNMSMYGLQVSTILFAFAGLATRPVKTETVT